MSRDILIITSSDEPMVSRITELLDASRVFRLNTDHLLEDTTFSFSLTEKRGDWCFKAGEELVALNEVRSIWYRRPNPPRAPMEISETDRQFVENEGHRFLRSLWLVTEEQRILWVNHPRALQEIESNKPRQSQLAAMVGLRIPETVITNNAGVVRDFHERWGGEVVIKTFGGIPFRAADGGDMFVYTTRLSRAMLDRFGEEVKYAPVMLQNYIPKALELRITAVGEQLFAGAIYSQDSPRTKDDWRRYDFGRVKHEPYNLPTEIQEKLLAFMKEVHLAFGAIDMILTPEGEYVFLEVNPSGQWGWIEHLTGMPISRAIAGLLANPP